MLLFFIIIPVLCAAVIAALFRHRALLEFSSVAGALLSLGAASVAVYQVAYHGAYAKGLYLSLDPLGAIVLLIVAVAAAITSIYSVAYLRAETKKGIFAAGQIRQYFFLQNLFVLAMFIAAMSANPVMMWITIEATTLATAFLVSYYNKPSAVEGAWKYLIINSLGLLFGFLGTLLFLAPFAAGEPGAFASWDALRGAASQFDPALIKMAFVFVLIGYGTKIGFVPLHTWKPDAYSMAPSPVGALFSAALFPVAILALLRFKTIADIAVGSAFSGKLFLIFGLASMLVASIIIFTSRNYKRLFAYSSIENAGLIALGFAFGGIGALASLLHLIYHSLIKSGLFLLSGNFLLRYGSRQIANVRGTMKTMPISSALFVAGIFAVGGVAPFGTFITKMLIFSTGLIFHPIVVILALSATIIAFIGLLKHMMAMVYSEPDIPNIVAGEQATWLTLAPMLLFATLIYLSIATPAFLITLVRSAVSAL